MIKAFAFVAYPVADIARSTAFYRGESSFVITKGEAVGVAAGSQFSAAFEVDDVTAARERLVTQNVALTAIGESPVCRSCFVTDPDGNRFALHERKVH